MKFFVVFACALAAASASYASPYGAPQLVGNGVPVDTPEVQQARSAHLQALAQASARNGDYAHGGQQSYAAPSYSAQSYSAPAYNHQAYAQNPVHQYVGASPDGHPLDTAEVEAEKSRHFAAFSQALARAGPIENDNGQYNPQAYNSAPAYNPAPAYQPAQAYNPAPYNAPAYHGVPNAAQVHNGLHIPVISNGVPVETAEVQQARAAHFAAFSKIAPSPSHY